MTGSEVAAIVLLSAAFVAQVGGVGLIVWDIRDDLRQAREMAEVPIIPPESFIQQVSSSTFSFALPQSRDPAMELAQHQHRHATLFQKFVQDVLAGKKNRRVWGVVILVHGIALGYAGSIATLVG
jgi:hypothetical protein